MADERWLELAAGACCHRWSELLVTRWASDGCPRLLSHSPVSSRSHLVFRIYPGIYRIRYLLYVPSINCAHFTPLLRHAWFALELFYPAILRQTAWKLGTRPAPSWKQRRSKSKHKLLSQLEGLLYLPLKLQHSSWHPDYYSA